MTKEPRTGRSASLEVPATQRRTLEEWSTRKDDPALARRARIVLKAGEGVPSTRIARELGVSRPTVTLWRRRFQEGGLDAVARIKAGRGRRPSLSAHKVRLVLDAGRRPPPRGQTRWTVRATAAYADVSPDTVQRLWREHGVQPRSAEAPAAPDGRRALADHWPDAGEGPAAASLAVGPPHLPVPLSSFVGRRQELAHVETLLGRFRLLTLVGCPGIGKSRLALETATCLPTEAGEPCFVELGPVSEPRLVVHSVASGLGVRERAGERLTETLVAYLRPRRGLLVLDNCEHVLAACAELIATLLRSCPQLTVLATSQEPLGVPGERVWQVPPLTLPAGDGGDLEAAEAVRLFCERAGSQSGLFALQPEAAGDVVEICRRLDGNPLAIELAAARAGAMTPSMILARLEQRFRLLTSGSRAGPPRHRTLEAAIGWSFELLPAAQQVLLRRLAVFAGEITPEAAEEVCGEGMGEDVFYLLAGLVERSLVVAEVADRHARYRLLESIGAFARDRLAESGEADRVRDRFAVWCTTLVERAEPELAGPAQREWRARLESEHDNILAALGHSLAAGQVERALRIAGAVATFWRLHGYLHKGADLLEACLAAAGPEIASEIRVRVSHHAGGLAAMLGDFPTAKARGEESLRGAEQGGDHAAAARALTLIGSVAMDQGEPNGAADRLEHAVTLARTAGDERCLADALARCGQVRMLQADHESALALFVEGHELARRLGDRQAETFALIGQGWAAMDRGDHATGEVRLRQALQLARAHGDRFRTGEALAFLGELARLRGDLDEAHALFGECEHLALTIRAPLLQARALGGRGRIELSRQRYDAARVHFDRGATVAGQVGLPYVRTRLLLGASACASATDDSASAQQLLTVALHHARRHHDRQGAATALHASAVIARRTGSLDRAALLHAEALQMHVSAHDGEAVARSLEGLAGVALERVQFVFAARLFGAAAASWQSAAGEDARWPWERERHGRDVARLRDALGIEALHAAWQEGSGRSREDVIGYALRHARSPKRASGGPAGLTDAECDVARLVVRGLTSREVADRLFVSPRTVDSHLGRVYRKLDIGSRRELREFAEGVPELQLVDA